MQRSRILVPVGCAALVMLVLTGCATRGYVRERVNDLRGEMDQMGGRLQAQGDQNAALATRALDRADSANLGIASVHDLAIGRVDYQETSRSSIHFAFNSATLDDEATLALDQVAAQVQSHPEYVIDLYGFADPAGPDLYNFELGRRRVETVERYLVGRSTGELSRYRTISFGEQIPATEASRIGPGAQRRQTLIVLLEKVPTQRSGPEELSSGQ